MLKAILKKESDSGRTWTGQQECLELFGTPWGRFITKNVSWALSRKLEGQIATPVVGATLLFGCEVRGFSNKEERKYEAFWSRVVFGKDRKTLADLRNCLQNEADPGLGSNSSTELHCELGQTARRPVGNIVLRGHVVPEHAVGVSKAAPKNTVRNQYRKQLLSVSHLAPEKLRSKWLKDWE